MIDPFRFVKRKVEARWMRCDLEDPSNRSYGTFVRNLNIASAGFNVAEVLHGASSSYFHPTPLGIGLAALNAAAGTLNVAVAYGVAHALKRTAPDPVIDAGHKPTLIERARSHLRHREVSE
jgi:hypothetical protein